MIRLFEKLRLIESCRATLAADDAALLEPLLAHMEAGAVIRATDDQIERIDALYEQFAVEDSREPV